MPAECPDLTIPLQQMGNAAVAEALNDQVRSCVQTTLLLRDWWHQIDQANPAEKIPLVQLLHRHAEAYGLIGQVPLLEGLLPVFGVRQRVLFHVPKCLPRRGHTIDWLCEQVRTFALRYFMRVSSSVRPLQRVAGREQGRPVPPLLQPLSWYPAQTGPMGLKYRQLCYQRRGEEIGSFPPGDQYRIIDVRDVGPVYDWVLLHVSIFDFLVSLPISGRNGPADLNLPLPEKAYVVLAPELVHDRRNPAPGLAGEYGFGYAILPWGDKNSPLAYGPSQLNAGFDFFTFQVYETGEVYLIETFVVNQPTRILNLDPTIKQAAAAADRATYGVAQPLLERGSKAAIEILHATDPVYLAIDAANALTGGMAGQLLCISNASLLKNIMVKHCEVELGFFLELMRIWNRFPSWTDAASLPRWVTDP